MIDPPQPYIFWSQTFRITVKSLFFKLILTPKWDFIEGRRNVNSTIILNNPWFSVIINDFCTYYLFYFVSELFLPSLLNVDDLSVNTYGKFIL